MSFDTEWLDMREPADHAARDPALLKAFSEGLPAASSITDFGSGTGSTLRAVSPFLPDARWRLTDNDPSLLAEAKRRSPDALIEQIDLAADLERALDFEADAITASALIDLVSADWIDRLVAGARGRAVYIALSYNGQEVWSPPHPEDDEILAAFRAHQRGDKGFGPALGSDAAGYLASSLERAGYSVRTADSPWKLSDGALMQSLAEGVGEAAGAAGADPEIVKRWQGRRLHRETCEIGHTDVLAVVNS